MNTNTTHSPSTLKNGSVRELWRISFPIMMSSLAMLFMIFVDRIFLSQYSIHSLNAAVSSGTLAWGFFGGIGAFTGMSEIFVAQHNGANKPEKIGAAVWQMIWIGIFSFLLFIPLGIWGGEFFFPASIYHEMQSEYFRYLMIFGPGYALMTALAGFYIGRGRTKLLIWLAIFANLINIVLDRAFIFGVEGWIPEMGIRGAAIATCIGYLIQTFILFFLFLLPKNRKRFQTNQWKLDKTIFFKSCRIGAPQGIFFSQEIFGWSIFYVMMTSISLMHITISSICQSILILLSFFLEGLGKGVAALAGNFIGAKKIELVKKVLRSGIYLQLIFTLITVTFFAFDPHLTLSYLLPKSEQLATFGPSFYNSLQICLIFTFLHLTFEGVRWILAGLLTAAGDTIFLLISGSLSIWLFLLLPVYTLIVLPKNSIELAWALTVAYSLICMCIYAYRFKKGKWKQIDFVQEVITEVEQETT